MIRRLRPQVIHPRMRTKMDLLGNHMTAHLHLLSPSQLRFKGTDYPCAIGKGGLTSTKQEGDGSTPCGSFRLTHVFYRPDRLPPPECPLPVLPLSPTLGWCDDPTSPDYNRLILRPFSPSHECLWRSDVLYNIVVILDYNLLPAVPGKGSAIFLHVAGHTFPSTKGCVALQQEHLVSILSQITPQSFLIINKPLQTE